MYCKRFGLLHLTSLDIDVVVMWANSKHSAVLSLTFLDNAHF